MALGLEERLGLHQFKQDEIERAVKKLNILLEKGKFTNDNPDSRYYYCKKVIEGNREAPQERKDNFNQYMSENTFEHIEKKHGIEWIRDKFRELQTIGEEKPVLYEAIKSHARTSYVYHKFLLAERCDLDPSERIELELMCLMRGSTHKKIELTEIQQTISDKVTKQMKSIENRAMAKAMVCTYVINYMSSSKNNYNDDVEMIEGLNEL